MLGHGKAGTHDQNGASSPHGLLESAGLLGENRLNGDEQECGSMHNKREIEKSKGSGDRNHGYHTRPRCSFIR